MKRRLFFASTAAAFGAGLIAATALAQQSTPPQNPPTTQTRPQMSPEDRAALIDARLAGIKAGLKLTAEQEKLWPPVEAAARDMAKQMQDARATRGARNANEDPVERMARMGDQMSQRGAAMVKVATAARPLYAALSDDQKRRLRILMHPTGMERHDRGGHGERDMMKHHGERGSMEHRRERRGWHDQH